MINNFLTPPRDNVADFDGSGYLFTPNIDTFPTRTLTLSFWMIWVDPSRHRMQNEGFLLGNGYGYRPDPSQAIVMRYGDINSSNMLGLTISKPSNLEVSWNNMSIKKTGVNVADQRWHHIAVTIKETTDKKKYRFKIYKDGNLAHDATLSKGSKNLQTGKQLILGQPNKDTLPSLNIDYLNMPLYTGFSGQISQFCIWKSVRSASEIKTEMTKKLKASEEKGLVYSLTLNKDPRNIENSNISFGKAVAALPNMALNLKAKYIPDPQNRVYNNKNLGYAFVCKSPYQFGKKNFTIELWVRARRSGSLFSSTSETGNTELEIKINKQGQLVTTLADRQSKLVAKLESDQPNIIDNEWHHVAVIRNGNQILHYIDGAPLSGTVSIETEDGGKSNKSLKNIRVQSQFQHNLGWSHEVTFGMGSSNIVANVFSGELDDVRIWGKALAANIISSHSHTRLQGDEDGLQAYWTFDDKNPLDYSIQKRHGSFYKGVAFTDETVAIVPDQKSYLVAQSKLMQDYFDYAGNGGKKRSKADRTTYRVVVTAYDSNHKPLAAETIRLSVDRPIKVQFEQPSKIVEEDWQQVEMTTNSAGQVSFAIPANARLFCPTVRIQATFMEAHDWLVVNPDRDAHFRLARTSVDELLGNVAPAHRKTKKTVLKNLSREQAKAVVTASSNVLQAVMGSVALPDKSNEPDYRWEMDLENGIFATRPLGWIYDQIDRNSIRSVQFPSKVNGAIAMTRDQGGAAVAQSANEFLEDAKRFFVQLAEDVEDAIEVIIETVQGWVSFIIKKIEDAIDFVEALFEKFKAKLKDLIDFLKILFEWDDILNTQKVLESYLRQTIPMLKAKVENLEDEVIDQIEGLQDTVNDLLDQYSSIAQTYLAGDLQSLSGQGSTEPQVDVQATYLQRMTVSNIKEVEFDDVLNGSQSDIFDEFIEAVNDIIDQTDFELLDLENTKLREILQNPEEFRRVVINDLIEALKFLANIAFELLKLGVKAVFLLFETLLTYLDDLLDQEIDIPIVADFYKNVVMQDSNAKLTPYSLFALLGAVPATVIYKLALGKAPFSNSDVTWFATNGWQNYSDLLSVPSKTATRQTSRISDEDHVRDVLSLVLGWAFWSDLAFLGAIASVDAATKDSVKKLRLTLGILGTVAQLTSFPVYRFFHAWEDLSGPQRLEYIIWWTQWFPVVIDLGAFGLIWKSNNFEKKLNKMGLAVGIYGVAHCLAFIALGAWEIHKMNNPEDGETFTETHKRDVRLKFATNTISTVTEMSEILLFLGEGIPILTPIGIGVKGAGFALWFGGTAWRLIIFMKADQRWDDFAIR